MLDRLFSRRRAAGDKPRAHLIHIGKTAGTAIKWALRDVTDAGDYQLELNTHSVKLRDVPKGDRVFFVVRDPVERFVSGFYSRQRQGRPRYDRPWSPEEEVAFTAFPTPGALGEALSSPDPRVRGQAETAMQTIKHVRDSYWNWFGDPASFTARLDDMLLIMWMPTVAETFPRLLELLGLPEDLVLPTDDVHAHRNPYDVDRGLSEMARTNLARWYASDYHFMEICEAQPCFVRNLSNRSSPGGAALSTQKVSH